MSALGRMFVAATIPLDPRGSPGSLPSLASVYRGLLSIGAAVEPETLESQRDLLLTHVNSLVAENDMKWERIHPRPGEGEAAFDFARADSIVAFAGQHGMAMRGHTLVWHQQTPAWAFGGSETDVLERIAAHISALLGRYRGAIGCWDVVNEALADGGGWRTDSGWQRTAGAEEGGLPRYLFEAYRSARVADPAARLFYNDYAIESGAKHEGAYRLAATLKERGLLDGVGIQGHWSVHTVEPGAVRRAIDRFASLGLEVQITELDLSVYRWGDGSSLPELTPELDVKLAEGYGELFKVFRDEARAGRLSGVTFWGFADDHTWLDDFPVKGRKDWPLLFDSAHRPKRAFRAVVEW